MQHDLMPGLFLFAFRNSNDCCKNVHTQRVVSDLRLNHQNLLNTSRPAPLAVPMLLGFEELAALFETIVRRQGVIVSNANDFKCLCFQYMQLTQR